MSSELSIIELPGLNRSEVEDVTPSDVAPPTSKRQRVSAQRRVHRALADLESAPLWLLAKYRDDISDLDRRAQQARGQVHAAGLNPDADID